MRFFKPDVTKLKKKGDIPGLIRALTYGRDRSVRQNAARTLGQLGGADEVRPLCGALGDEDYRVRRAAAQALGRLGNALAVEMLSKALDDDNSAVREAVAEALGRIGDPGAVAALCEALEDAEQNVRSSSRRALKRIQRQPELDTQTKEKIRRALSRSPKEEVGPPGVAPERRDKRASADYSLVKDQNNRVCGLWLQDASIANDQFLLAALLTQEGVPLPESFRVVPNMHDEAGGCFCMFGSARAPGE